MYLVVDRAIASMRQDEAIASSSFWPKIDLSEEKCHGKCLKESISEPLDFKMFKGGDMPQDPP